MARLSVNGDRVSLKEDGNENIVSKIIVPDNVNFKATTGSQKHVSTGTVLEKGQDCKFVEKGMHVLYGRQDAAPIEFEDQKIIIVRENTILFSFNDQGIDRITNDRILVDPDPLEKQTASGIIIPESAIYQPTTGRILKVGAECKWSKEGMQILFGTAAGSIIEFKGKNYLVLREADVIGPVE
jgi:chaperonin GroES